MTGEQMPLLETKLPTFPAAPFTGSIPLGGGEGKQLPQNIAHRGNKIAFPENSMKAFESAVAVGANAIETDLHLSKDGVVVLSHDASLKRCFGIDKKVADCDWSYLSSLRTQAEPHVPLARLSDLLTYIAQPDHQAVHPIWILLDIKTDDDPLDLLPALLRTIESVPPLPDRPWNERIVLGGWNENWISHITNILPNYPIAYIGFSIIYAHRFLSQTKYPNINFNLLQQGLVGPVGGQFIKAVRKAERRLYVWTVNEETWMQWSIKKGVDGVITDDPKKFREVCDKYSLQNKEAAAGGVERVGLAKKAKLYATAYFMQLVALVFLVLWWRRLKTRGKGRPQKAPTGGGDGKVVPISS
ncbi:glycerophosphoryl diester phosphodiesterase [Podospora fimiseda]|uniref:Glycerophosphoryl diester phosphodiesterase n=1 Tax=Podospora fimiseda TaxID=252190 RepID=A0AAN7BL67_9PEZI|nr:glycerophosphoryl diester phosphodiesterase [Podospora fimiseda]